MRSWLILLVFASILALGVLFKPILTGLFLAEEKYVEELNLSINASLVLDVDLKAVPKSLSISGSYLGKAKVYLAHNKTLLKIFDSEINNATEFQEVCLETCIIDYDEIKIKIVVDLAPGSILNLSKLHYLAKTKPNLPPKWISNSSSFEVIGQTVFNLSDYFLDPDGDEIVYLITYSEGFESEIFKEILTITPKKSGEYEVTLIATDFKSVTKVPVKFIVK